MNCDATNVRVLVVGIGNPLRGDDAVGWVAAQQLEDLLPKSGVRVEAHHQLLPELADSVSKVELVIFIDASCDEPPGQVSRRPVVPLADAASFTHGFEPPALLNCARTIFGRCARGMLFSVGAQSFDHGAELSEVVRQALPELLQGVQDLVTGWLTDEHDHGLEGERA